MANFICIVLLLIIVVSACFHIWKEKKRGNKCIGCPFSENGSCPKHCDNKSRKDKTTEKKAAKGK